MNSNEARPPKPEVERLDVALGAILLAVVVLAAVVVGGIQQRAASQASSQAAFVAR